MSSKMATENSIAKEMMNIFLEHNYCEYARYLTGRDAVNLSTFENTDVGKCYWIDTRNCYYKGRRNPNHLFDIFSKFSDDTSDVV